MISEGTLVPSTCIFCDLNGPVCPHHVVTDLKRLHDEVERLRALLTDVVSRFTIPGHPGRPCLRTHWIPVEKVEKWRESARAEDEGA